MGFVFFFRDRVSWTIFPGHRCPAELNFWPKFVCVLKGITLIVVELLQLSKHSLERRNVVRHAGLMLPLLNSFPFCDSFVFSQPKQWFS
jgi:hypothetical protein